MSIRRFKIGAGRSLALPQGLVTAPGANTMRLHSCEAAAHKSFEHHGEEFEVDAERCEQFQRFIAGRLRAGDLVELDASAAAPIAPPPAPTAQPVIELVIPTVPPSKEQR